MAYNNNIMFIRYQLLAKLVKMWKDDELLEKIDRLPIDLHPRKQKPLGRCCVYKERAVTKYKTIAMMVHEKRRFPEHCQYLATPCGMRGPHGEDRFDLGLYRYSFPGSRTVFCARRLRHGHVS